MIGSLKELMSFGAGQVMIVIVLVLVMIVEGKKLTIDVMNALGLETKSSKEKTACEDRIKKLEDHDKWQYDQILNISQGINDIKECITSNEKEEDMRRIKDLKSEILAFSRSLKRFDSDNMADDFTEEDYDRIYEAFQEYEDLLEKYDMENGKTTRAMKNINSHSEKRGFGSIDV